jgi:hypothetical protein
MILVAENESAKSLLENLSNLMTSIEEGNKPQTANIRLQGGYGFARFVGTLLTVVGVVVSLGAVGLIIMTMVQLPSSTSLPLRVLAATPSLGGMFSGLVLMGLGAITKANVDAADYSAQLLQLTKKQMEKR